MLVITVEDHGCVEKASFGQSSGVLKFEKETNVDKIFIIVPSFFLQEFMMNLNAAVPSWTMVCWL